MIILCEMLLRL